ncbi:hypothetical protein LguiB_020863 [Lonicera macranthoides]
MPNSYLRKWYPLVELLSDMQRMDVAIRIPSVYKVRSHHLLICTIPNPSGTDAKLEILCRVCEFGALALSHDTPDQTKTQKARISIKRGKEYRCADETSTPAGNKGSFHLTVYGSIACARGRSFVLLIMIFITVSSPKKLKLLGEMVHNMVSEVGFLGGPRLKPWHLQFPFVNSKFVCSPRASAVKHLVKLIDPAAGMIYKAVAVLSNLATIPEGRPAIGQEGAIPVLVEVVYLCSVRGK